MNNHQMRDRFTKHMDISILDFDINSRKELEAIAAEEGAGEINWTAWDKAKQQTQKQIEAELRKTRRKPVYVYTADGFYINTFNSALEAGEEYKISQQAVNVYIKMKMPYQKLNIIFRNTPFNYANSRPKWVYQKKKEKWKLIGIFESAEEAAAHLNIPYYTISRYCQWHRPYKDYLFRGQPI